MQRGRLGMARRFGVARASPPAMFVTPLVAGVPCSAGVPARDSLSRAQQTCSPAHSPQLCRDNFPLP